MEDLTKRRRLVGRMGWVAVGVWAALIFGLSSIPGKSFPPEAGWFGVDKIAHALVFAVMGFLVARASGRSGKTAFLLALGCASGYGLLDELHQRFTPGRDSSFWDFLADTLGGAIGGAAHLVLSARRAEGEGK